MPGTGLVETWWDLTEVNGPLVRYRRTYVFAPDGTRVTSDSTRRFWTRAEIEDSLAAAGYTLAEVRDAPDRPGREWSSSPAGPDPTRSVCHGVPKNVLRGTPSPLRS